MKFPFYNENWKRNKNNLLAKEDLNYVGICFLLKSEGVSKDYLEIKKSDSFYRKGKIKEAYEILVNLWNEIQEMKSISPEDIKYYGN